MPEGALAGRPRLYEDGIFPTEDGRARFAPVAFRPVAEPVDAPYPFSLISGRLRDQWHGMSRTGTLGRLFGHVPEPVAEMNAADLDALGLKDGDLVEVRSRRGSVVLAAQAGTAVAPGQVSIPMHWGEEVLGGTDADGVPRRGVNGLTLPTFCPGSKQPELKHSAVSIAKAELPWRMVGMAWLPQEEITRVRERLRTLMPHFAHAMVLPFGREPHDGGLGGVIWRASAATPAEAALIAEIAALLGLDGSTAMRYEDAERGQFRSARLDGGRLRSVLLAGDTCAESWIRTLVKDELPAQAYGRRLLAASATPPVAITERGRQVCTCFNVTEPQIVEQLGRCEGSAEARLSQLQGALKCGTNCGSCLPVLRGLVKASIPLVPVAG